MFNLNINREEKPNRTKRAMALWLQVAAEYKKGDLTASTIANKYINPKTGKPHCASYVYWVMRRLKKEGVKI